MRGSTIISFSGVVFLSVGTVLYSPLDTAVLRSSDHQNDIQLQSVALRSRRAHRSGSYILHYLLLGTSFFLAGCCNRTTGFSGCSIVEKAVALIVSAIELLSVALAFACGVLSVSHRSDTRAVMSAPRQEYLRTNQVIAGKRQQQLKANFLAPKFGFSYRSDILRQISLQCACAPAG